MGPFDVAIFGSLILFGSGVALTALGVFFKLKKKEQELRERELEMRGRELEMRGSDTGAELAEIQERLDFAERMLAAGRPSQDAKNG